MSDDKNVAARKALSAEEFSALFRRNADNERLYRESEIRLDLAERMTEMRRAAGLSQQQFADRVGRKQPFIARLERGAYDRCGLSTLRTFARAMGYELDASRMFVEGTAAYFSGNSSCLSLEQSFEIVEEQSGKMASISLASWERSELASQTTPAASNSKQVNYSAA